MITSIDVKTGEVTQREKTQAEIESYAVAQAEQDADAPLRSVRLRQAAYTAESDPLFFQQQAGEMPAGTWEAKRAEIRARYP